MCTREAGPPAEAVYQADMIANASGGPIERLWGYKPLRARVRRSPQRPPVVNACPDARCGCPARSRDVLYRDLVAVSWHSSGAQL